MALGGDILGSAALGGGGGSGGGSAINIIGSAGIPSAEAFGITGATVVNFGTQILYRSDGIPSAETFGAGGAVVLTPGLVGTAGIPSAEAFGSGGTVTQNPGLVGTAGIPSAEAFGVGAVLVGDQFSIFINGALLNNKFLVNTLNINQPMGQTATAEAQFWDQTAVMNPQVGQTMLVYDGNTRIFGGTIDEVTQSAYQANPGQRWDVKASDFSGILDRRIIGKFYPSAGWGSLELIAADIVTNYLSADGISYNTIDGDPGTQLGDQLFQWVTARECFNRLSSATGWDFTIDYYGALRFFPKGTGTGAAPFNLQDNDGNWLAETMTVRHYRSTYRNRQFVQSSTQGSQLWVDTFSAAQPGPIPSEPQPPNGVNQDFITLYGITGTPVVKVNGNTQRVITLNQIGTNPVGDWDWYWIPQQGAPSPANGVFQNNAQSPLISSDVLTVGYPTDIQPVTVVVCQAQVDARAAVEGNSGFYDDVQQAQNITDPAALQTYAQGLLDRYGCTSGIPIQVMYETFKHGLFVGQIQHINTSNPAVSAADYLISNVTIRDVDNGTYQGKPLLRYQITADSGHYLGEWQQFYRTLITAALQPQPSNRMVYTWSLAPTIPGVTNPGLGPAGGQNQFFTIQHQSEIPQYVSCAFRSMPGTPTRSFEVLVNTNGTGVFVTPQSQELEARSNFPTGFKFTAGDVLTLLIRDDGGSGDAYKDGYLILQTSVAVG